MRSYHDDVKRVKTKAKTKSVKYYEQLRQEELERQCEEFYMSLDCKEEECDVCEEDEEWDVLTPSLVEEHEEVMGEEPDSEVRMEETESLKDSSLNGSRKEVNVAGMLLCSCQDCRKEFQGYELDEPLGFEVGHSMTMMGKEEQLGLVVGKWVNSVYISSCLKASNLLGYDTLCPIFGRPVLGGKIYDLLTPHYHCNMLMRLMERLVDMNAAVSLFESENNLFQLHSSHLAVVKLCCVLVVESFFGLNCLSLTIIELNLPCPNDGVIWLSTWESIRGTKREKQKYFYVQIPEVNDVMEYHGVWLDGMLEGHFQCQLDGIWGIHSLCCVGGLFAGCGKSEHLRNLFEPNTTSFRRLNQWVNSVWDYDLPWFKWLIMMTVENGVVSYLWSWGGMILMCVDGEKGSEVAVSHRCSFANNDSNCKWKVENQLLVTVRMQLRGCHGELFKVQSEAAQSIGKWFDLTEFDMKENKEDVVAMHVHGIMRPVSFILETRIPVVSNNQSLKLDAKIFEKNTVDYFLKNSVGDDLKHTTDVGIVGLLCDDLNLKSSIWKAENYGGRIWCKVLYPFHYGKINCKMKIVHSSTNKNHLMQLIKWIISTDARENELVMILKWELKIMPIVEFKNTWVGIVNTTVVAARTNSDKTAKDVIEWMIAWERQTQY